MQTQQFNTIDKAIKEIQKQLRERDYYMHNYRFLDSVQTYLDNCLDKDDEDFDQAEQIFNYLVYDLGWEENDETFEPVEL